MQADFSIQDVLTWARTKPADERYDYIDAGRCAVAQFGEATGRNHLIGIGPLRVHYPELENVVQGNGDYCDWTFGRLVKRLEALCPETIVTPSEWTRLDAYLTDMVSA